MTNPTIILVLDEHGIASIHTTLQVDIITLDRNTQGADPDQWSTVNGETVIAINRGTLFPEPDDDLFIELVKAQVP